MRAQESQRRTQESQGGAQEYLKVEPKNISNESPRISQSGAQEYIKVEPKNI